jgi:hypothetical protein
VQAALRREPALDRVIAAGDVLQGSPRPVEVWETLTGFGWTRIQGNEDAALAAPQPPIMEPGYRYQQAYAAQHAWMRAHLDASITGALGGCLRSTVSRRQPATSWSYTRARDGWMTGAAVRTTRLPT